MYCCYHLEIEYVQKNNFTTCQDFWITQGSDNCAWIVKVCWTMAKAQTDSGACRQQDGCMQRWPEDWPCLPHQNCRCTAAILSPGHTKHHAYMLQGTSIHISIQEFPGKKRGRGIKESDLSHFQIKKTWSGGGRFMRIWQDFWHVSSASLV